MSTRSRTLILLPLFLGLFFFGELIPVIGPMLTYPFKLMGTILHEVGHAIGALVTGGDVKAIQINMNGSGHCLTAGGNRAITLMGGYIGSIIFGNIILRISLAWPQAAKATMWALFGIMAIVSTIWSNSIGNTLFVAAFGAGIYFINKYNWHNIFLVAIGTMVVIHVILDFNVGPSSDLKAFTEVLPILPYHGWMYTWLGIAVLITGANVISLFRKTE